MQSISVTLKDKTKERNLVWFNTEQASVLTVSALPKGNKERLISWGFKSYQSQSLAEVKRVT